jgi:hypothetical protein
MACHLGRDVLRADLLPALLSIVHNHMSWVDSAVVGAVTPLLEALPPANHEQLLRLISKIAHSGADTERCRTWRLRRKVAAQLGRLARACPRAVSDVLWPAAITLCSDPVAAVRAAAAVEVGPLLAVVLPLVEEQQAEGSGGTRRQQPPSAGQDSAAGQDSTAGQDQHHPSRDGHLLQKQASQRSLVRDQGAEVGSSSSSSSVGAEAKSGSTLSAFTLIGSPHRGSAPAGAMYGSSYGSTTSEDESELFGGLPCALAAPPCSGLTGSPPLERAPLMEGCWDSDCNADGARLGEASGDAYSGSEQGSGSCGSSGGGGESEPEDSTGSGSESDGEGAARLTLARTLTPMPMHPAMMHPAMHPAMMHPAMAPASASSGRPQPKRTSSASALPVSRRPAAARRRSTASRLGARRGSCDAAATADAGLDPLCAEPALYVDSLVDRFARSRSFQGRQLFVTMALGLLQASLLPARKRELVTAALEALAVDRVASVRVVAEGAAAALQAAASERALAQQAASRPAPAPAVAGPACSPPVDNNRPAEAQPALGAGEAAGVGGGVRERVQQRQGQQGSCGPGGSGGGVRFDATLLNSQQYLMRAARALARDNPGSFKAASAALAVQHAVHGAAAAVPITINANH